MKDQVVTYPEETDLDDEAFRQGIRMNCHISGYEVVDFGYNGQDGKPYVTFRKKAKRKASNPKQRFF